MTSKIFISGNVPSSKNSKVWTGKFLVNSKITTQYKKHSENEWIAYRGLFREMVKDKPLPYHIEFKFIRDSKRLFDFVNMAQILLDLMQEFSWIENDDYKNVVPYFSEEVIIDKERAGVEIRILK